MISIKIHAIPDEDPSDWLVWVDINAYHAYDILIPNRQKYPDKQRPRAWHNGITIYAYLPNWNGAGVYDSRQVSATCSPNDLLNWLRYSLQVERDMEHEVTQVLGKGGWHV